MTITYPPALDPPYLKKIRSLGQFTLWLVDGRYVRSHLDIEFTNFGQIGRFNFIPQNEFWLDQGYKAAEEKYFIIHLLVENRLMSRGKSYYEAIAAAEMAQNRARQLDLARRKPTTVDLEPLLAKMIYKRLYKKYSHSALKVWLVNGHVIRNFLYINFTAGGHGHVYPFIPKDEIWIDDNTHRQERRLVLLHELCERSLMPPDQSITLQNNSIILDDFYQNVYDQAHAQANELEHYCRHNPRAITKKVQEELQKTSSPLDQI